MSARLLSWFVVPTEPDAIRRQESVLILLNLTVLAGIAFVHLLFGRFLATPSRAFFIVLMARFLLQAFELLWVRGASLENSAAALVRYGTATIWVNLAFAFVLTVLGGIEDTHYAVLMVIPVIAAGFRYSGRGIALVVAVGIVLTFLELQPYTRGHKPALINEYFEAANISFIYLVVAAVVATLAAHQRRDQARLEASISELQRTRDRLVTEEKLAAVGRLSGAIAHEVRNPVAMIVSALDMVKDESLERDKRREWCEIAGQEARRLESLTTDFLAYARQKDPERQPTSIATTLGYVAGLARARGAGAGITLDVDHAGDFLAPFDPFQIHQALLNMVLNAFDATGRGGRIVIGATGGTNDRVTFFVENTGEPIPPDVVPRLCEPFFTTKQRGSGLGLAISRTIARAHGGELRLAVNRPDAIRFELTIAAGMPAAARG